MTALTEDPDCALPAALATVAVQRHEDGRVSPWVDDVVAVETPVALVFNGISHAVMMCTPQDLSELALGFALSEGLIDGSADCYGMDVVGGRIVDGTTGCAPELPAVEVRMDISARAFMRLKARRRNLAGRTGCGVCGIDSLQALDIMTAPMAVPPRLAQVGPAVIFKALAAMSDRQTLNRSTGAVHAAAYATLEGDLVAVYEDVGRHNALDKLLGARALASRHGSSCWPQEGFVVMSSRASHELVRKCARLGVPLLATISAPTSLAIHVAEAVGLQLWGLAREPRVLRYTRCWGMGAPR